MASDIRPLRCNRPDICIICIAGYPVLPALLAMDVPLVTGEGLLGEEYLVALVALVLDPQVNLPSN